MGRESQGRQEGCPVVLRPGLEVQVSSLVATGEWCSGPFSSILSQRRLEANCWWPQLRESLGKSPAWNLGFLSPLWTVSLVWGVDGITGTIGDIISEQGTRRCVRFLQGADCVTAMRKGRRGGYALSEDCACLLDGIWLYK